jgi:hypothetical protein
VAHRAMAKSQGEIAITAEDDGKSLRNHHGRRVGISIATTEVHVIQHSGFAPIDHQEAARHDKVSGTGGYM